MRLTRQERGTSYTRTHSQPYVLTYTQPVHNYVIQRLYHHIWEKLTWRIYRRIEKLTKQNARAFTEDFYLPLTVRQDIRCYHLRIKNRIELKQEYGEKVEHDPTQRG